MRLLIRPDSGPANPDEPRRKRPRYRGFVAATAAAGLLTAACGAAEDTTTAADGGSGDEATQDGPRFDATVFSGEALTVSGEAFDLGSLEGKDLVLWFWAPW